ncbi:hypothetical protein [Pseudomonas juntendi]|uniref:hypothetical protein n=1 Tax=Pseudomonas juntendi TaxID=2666183 RepID=UPI00244C7F30|nr:hypothetical protein [Pseudomonas juntendi]MDH1551014.1 hypothetical protein [Pseudomonas juntendi]
MIALRIIACGNRTWWYRDLVGKVVPLVRHISEGYLSREPEGYTNVVKGHEAEIIEVPDDQKFY